MALSPDKRLIYITVKITEGEQYRISKIDFSGDLIVPKQALFDVLESRHGRLLQPGQGAQATTPSLADIYQDQGYAYANFNPETSVNRRGPDGGPRLPAWRRESSRPSSGSTSSGTPRPATRSSAASCGSTRASSSTARACKRSKERVNALGFFETVEITYKPGRDDSHVIVTVEVKEKSTGSFQVGFGFSSVESFIFTAQVTQNNFLGWGQTVSLSAQLSSLRQLVQLSFYDPYFFDTDWIFSLDLYRTQIDQFDFTRQALGGSVGLGYHICDDVIGSVGYTREWVEASPGGTGTGPNAGVINTNTAPLFGRFRTGTQVTSAARLSVAWDKRDNRLFATKGFYQFLSAEFAPELLGGDLNYVRYTAFSRFYFPLPLGAVFKTNVTVGYIGNLDPTRRLPVSELFYLGGINSVRGYALNSISPTILVAHLQPPGLPGHRVRGRREQAVRPQSRAGVPHRPQGGPEGRGLLRHGECLRGGRQLVPGQAALPAAGDVPLGGLRHPLVFAGGSATLRVGHSSHPPSNRRSHPLRVHHRQLLLSPTGQG